MATTIQLRRGTSGQNDSFTGAVGEITYDTTNKTLRTHDNSTTGGTRLAVHNDVLDRLQVANAAAIYATKAYAAANTYVNAQIGSSNTSIRQYVNAQIGASNTSIRQYVDTEVAGIVDSAPETLNTLNELAAALGDDANFATTTTTLIGTKAANTYVNQTFETKAVALSSNNAQNSLILDRLQVANAEAIYATKAYAAANTYVNAQIGASNTNIRSYTDATYETKAVALSSNSAQNVLINDRVQVANARVEFLQSSNTSVTNDATSITVAQSTVDLNDRALVNPAGFITINIGGTDYKLPFYS